MPDTGAVEPNDPRYDQQWHLPLIQAPEAWGILSQYRTRYPVRVAVIDETVDRFHDDFAGVPMVDGFDFPQNRPYSPYSPVPESWEPSAENHGTHITGLIAAAANNGIGVSGVAWDGFSVGGVGQIEVMPLNIFGATNSVASDLAAAVLYAAGLPNDTGYLPVRPASVINLSLGTNNEGEISPAAFELAQAAGVVMVAASGNGRENGLIGKYEGVDYPAAFDSVIAVGSVDGDRTRSVFSDYGPRLELVAPGGYRESSDPQGPQVVSTLPDNVYGDRFGPTNLPAVGTSMATPLVTGVIAQMYSVNPWLTNQQVRTILAETTVDLGPVGWDAEYGHGLLNAHGAIRGALAAPQPSLLPSLPAARPTIDAELRGRAARRLKAVAADSQPGTLSDRDQTGPEGVVPVTAERFVLVLDPETVPDPGASLETYLRDLEETYGFSFLAPGPQWIRAMKTNSPVDVQSFTDLISNDPKVISASVDSVLRLR